MGQLFTNNKGKCERYDEQGTFNHYIGSNYFLNQNQNDFGYDDVLNTYLYPKYGKEVVDKVINRHKNSEFKRHNPHKIILSHDDV